VKVTQTAIVDLELFNAALTAVQTLSGEVSFMKVLPIVQAFQQCIVPPPPPKEELSVEEMDRAIERFKKAKECPSPTPPKNSSKKSGTNTK
jgi:hypothetical protein